MPCEVCAKYVEKPEVLQRFHGRQYSCGLKLQEVWIEEVNVKWYLEERVGYDYVERRLKGAPIRQNGLMVGNVEVLLGSRVSELEQNVHTQL